MLRHQFTLAPMKKWQNQSFCTYILSRATCEGASQIRWREDSIVGMVKWGASNLAGYTKNPNPLHLMHKQTKIIQVGTGWGWHATIYIQSSNFWPKPLQKTWLLTSSVPIVKKNWILPSPSILQACRPFCQKDIWNNQFWWRRGLLSWISLLSKWYKDRQCLIKQ